MQIAGELREGALVALRPGQLECGPEGQQADGGEGDGRDPRGPRARQEAEGEAEGEQSPDHDRLLLPRHDVVGAAPERVVENDDCGNSESDYAGYR